MKQIMGMIVLSEPFIIYTLDIGIIKLLWWKMPFIITVNDDI